MEEMRNAHKHNEDLLEYSILELCTKEPSDFNWNSRNFSNKSYMELNIYNM